MRRSVFFAAALAILAAGHPAWAQQDDIASLRAELVRQQAVIADLLKRLEALDQKVSQAATKEDVTNEVAATTDAVSSVRETLLGKVNLNGYLNARYFADKSEAANGFQINPLAIVMSKQLGRFNFFGEMSLQFIPHHAQIVQRSSESTKSEGESGAVSEVGHVETGATDVSGERAVEVRNAWIEYTQARALNVRVGKFLSPQYFWQNHYPNVILSTDLPIHLREMFPPELVGAMVSGTVARPAGDSEIGVGYKFYVANNESETSVSGDVRAAKSWGGRLEMRAPARGPLKTLNFAADFYRGRTALESGSDVEQNHVWGLEEQLEISRFMLNAEYARGRWQESTRFGYYLQPAARFAQQWIGFYRLEGLESARVQEAERRHLLGINYRPLPQVALKLEYYRSVPLERSFLFIEKERKPFNGIAAATAFFF